MSQVLVWKCDHDGKLFEDRTKYQAHLKKLAAQRAQDRKIQKAKEQHDQFIVSMGNTVKSFAELEQFIKDNWGFFYFNGLQRNRWKTKNSVLPKHNLVHVRFERMQWNNSVSNSHSCPRDGVQNWSGKNCLKDGTPAPNGYPGWHGSINIGISKKTPTKNQVYLDGFGSDYFENTGIHTGTGGGGRSKDGVARYSYEVRLYASDWPAMFAEKVKSEAWERLGGQKLKDVI